MSESKIKNAQIPHAGYDYQNLYGMKILIDWYHNPSQYNWVKLECEDDQSRGIDDIVAERMDGQYECWQIKFTVDSQKHILDFDWLLKKKEKWNFVSNLL